MDHIRICSIDEISVGATRYLELYKIGRSLRKRFRL